MDALQYLIVQPETQVVVWLGGWVLGVTVGSLLALVVTRG